jgi:autophagy-related protein 17
MFERDILHFHADIQNLKKAIAMSAISPPSPSVSRQPSGILLHSLIDHTHNMADLLSSLTKHFDLCVTAVRTTDGGAALARRKAAEATQAQDDSSVSISGVIAKQESDVSDLEPITSQDRADIIRVVLDDASEVEGVVHEMNQRLAAMEVEFETLEQQTVQIRAAHKGTLSAFRALEDIGNKMPHYIAAETDFLVRWEDEKAAILARLQEMDGFRDFYQGYALAYDRLLVEVDRRRLVEERIRGIWKKAAESVDRLIEEDRQSRDFFMQDAGEFLPTDLWPGMRSGLKRWEVRPVEEFEVAETSNPALAPDVVEAAQVRITKVSS